MFFVSLLAGCFVSMACPVIQFIATCEISEVCADAQQTLHDIVRYNAKHPQRSTHSSLRIAFRKGKIETVTIFTILKNSSSLRLPPVSVRFRSGGRAKIDMGRR